MGVLVRLYTNINFYVFINVIENTAEIFRVQIFQLEIFVRNVYVKKFTRISLDKFIIGSSRFTNIDVVYQKCFQYFTGITSYITKV